MAKKKTKVARVGNGHKNGRPTKAKTKKAATKKAAPKTKLKTRKA